MQSEQDANRGCRHGSLLSTYTILKEILKTYLSNKTSGLFFFCFYI